MRNKNLIQVHELEMEIVDANDTLENFRDLVKAEEEVGKLKYEVILTDMAEQIILLLELDDNGQAVVNNLVKAAIKKISASERRARRDTGNKARKFSAR